MALTRGNKEILIGLAILLIGGGLVSIFVWSRQQLPSHQTIQVGDRIMTVEEARTPAAHYRGLSGRPSLCPNCGMIFIFPDKQVREFVMREMHFPLDIIFIAEGRIIKIASNLAPEGNEVLTVYSSDQPADQVLEVNAGDSAKYNFKVGDRILFNLRQ